MGFIRLVTKGFERLVKGQVKEGVHGLSVDSVVQVNCYFVEEGEKFLHSKLRPKGLFNSKRRGGPTNLAGCGTSSKDISSVCKRIFS
ncbi:MAG: hypothetical protein DWQ04_11245 [Chloroflexi bacterium]|nr:MAG: hypothetical protein DWQ04_11245 [Chloroflexota bacterium]